MTIVEFKKTREPDAGEFERLYRESYASVYSSVLYRMLDEEAARDVTAEAFLKAARYFHRCDPERASFATWVKVIARNCAMDYYRQHKAHAPIDQIPESAFADDVDLERRTADADLARFLLSRLAELDREIVRLKFYEGMRNVEIARVLGMNPSSVATRIQRALARMRAAADESMRLKDGSPRH